MRFERGLNEDIRAMVGMLKIKEMVVLTQHTQKMEAIWKEKKQAKAKKGT